jgi:HSP20 family protein
MLALHKNGDVFVSPFNRFAELQRELDQWFNGALPDGRTRHGVRAWAPPMDVQETPGEVQCTLEVPGVDPSDMDIQIEDGVLTISGERRQEQTSQANGVHVSERRFGRFVRTLRLPVQVDADRVSARYENGLLHISLPKTEQARARRIEIQAAGADRQPAEKTT